MFFPFQYPLRGSIALLAVGSRVLNIDIPPKSPFGKGGLRQGSRSPKGNKKKGRPSDLPFQYPMIFYSRTSTCVTWGAFGS